MPLKLSGKADSNMAQKRKKLIAAEWSSHQPLLIRFMDGLRQQLEQLFAREAITNAAPVECRIKSWNSISEKMKRRGLKIDSVLDLPDLVGLRCIFLFKRDLEEATRAIIQTFRVLSREDTSSRLTETQFGYQSLHYLIAIPEPWRTLPIFHGCGDLRAELQLRTAAQHIWAAASHKLQYKREENVPVPLRRAIHRVSALLETVDLEFERVLQDRETYSGSTSATEPDEVLNVDLLQAILAQKLPPENADRDEEDYSDLLSALEQVGTTTVGALEDLISKRLAGAIARDKKRLAEYKKEKEHFETLSKSRLAKNVFFTHCGLVRMMCLAEYGDEWLNRQ